MGRTAVFYTAPGELAAELREAPAQSQLQECSTHLAVSFTRAINTVLTIPPTVASTDEAPTTC